MTLSHLLITKRERVILWKKIMRNLFFILLLVFNYSLSFSQKIVGDWKGSIEMNGNKIPIIFHFAKNTSGDITGTWDSPLQNAKNLPFSKIEVAEDSVHLDIQMIAGSYQGKFIGDDSITGIWKQGNGKIALNFSRTAFQPGEATQALNQKEDQKAYPNEKEISIFSSLGARIYGTLLSKNKSEKLAIIIAGSGPTDRNGNNPMGVDADSYKMLAHALDAQNIASFRFDKSFIGKSSVPGVKEEDVTFDNAIKDVENIVDYMRDTLGFKNVYLVGHSEGSLIGMVVAKRKKIEGYISVAGMGRPFDTIVEEQINTQRWPDSLKSKSAFIFEQLKKGHLVDNIPASMEVLFRKSVQPYLISLLKYNPEREIKKLHCPILILQGSCDVQITVADADKLHNANPKSSLKIIPGMTHTLKNAGESCAGENKTYTDNSLPLDADLVKSISGFIQKN